MLIGITGTDGAGKGSVVEYLVKEKGYRHYSARAFIIEEIEQRGLPVDRDHTRIVANSMREEHGSSFLVTKAVAAAKEEGVENYIIESIRSWGEAEEIKIQDGFLLAIDADPLIRYERNKSRGTALDNISFEKFTAQEAAEMNDPNPSGMQKAKVMEVADYTILNEGTLEELHTQIDVFLEKYAT
tara:strand:- start:310 stop:864 length:555 start_codon:yes stop_codon:yes gene_type:complete